MEKKESYRSLLEMGPLLLFFGVNYFYGIIAGTTVLVVSTIIALAISWYFFKNIPMIAAFGCLLVVLFGGLTIYREDDFFIKIKPTIASLVIAVVLLIGQLLRKNFLSLVMRSTLKLDLIGWNKLTWLFVAMFLTMAVANEIAWRNLSTDDWVSFKAFGIPALSIVFSVFMFPIIKKHKQE